MLVRRAWEKRQLAKENQFLHSKLARVDATPEILTSYAPMQALLGVVERAAAADTPVLITLPAGVFDVGRSATAYRYTPARGGRACDTYTESPSTSTP